MRLRGRCNGREERSDYRVYHVDGFDDFGNNGFARWRKRPIRNIERDKMLDGKFLSTPLRRLRKAGFTDREIEELGELEKKIIKKRISELQQEKRNKRNNS